MTNGSGGRPPLPSILKLAVNQFIACGTPDDLAFAANIMHNNPREDWTIQLAALQAAEHKKQNGDAA